MMSFCRKSVHSLLSFTTNNNHNQTPTISDDDDDIDHNNSNNPIINPHPNCSKLGLITLITDPNESSAAVLESSSLIAKPSPPEKKDPGGIGFIDDIGGGVDGLMSCTESLGFESSDERGAEDDVEGTDDNNNNNDDDDDGRESLYGSLMQRSSRRRRTATEFPPPLPSLDRNGRPSFFLRPVRKDGRLELTEVRINRPEILRAYRGDGRLRLHFIRDEDQEQDNTGDNDDLDCIQEEQEIVQDDDDDNNIRNRLISSNNNNNNNNSGEGFRRCHDEVNQNDNLHRRRHHHHHQNQLWRSQRHCVITTR